MPINIENEIRRLLIAARDLRQDTAAFLGFAPVTLNQLRNYTDSLRANSDQVNVAVSTMTRAGMTELEIEAELARKIRPAPVGVLMEIAALQSLGEEIISAYASEAYGPKGGVMYAMNPDIPAKFGLHAETPVDRKDIATMTAKGQELHDRLAALVP